MFYNIQKKKRTFALFLYFDSDIENTYSVFSIFSEH